MKQRELNRKQYDRIRKMDHQQMKEYFQGVYQAGFEAGAHDAREREPLPDLDGLEEDLQKIRGIGGAKSRAIQEAVMGFLQRKKEKYGEAGS